MGLDCLIDSVTERYLRALPACFPEELAEFERELRRTELPISSPEATELLITLCHMMQPKRILEIGTCVGFSSLVMSSCCPMATIDTIERYPVMIADAKENFKRFGNEKITLFEGDAALVLGHLTGPYDMIYLDAAKGQYPYFLPECLRLLAEGGIFVSDNVLFRGQVCSGRPDTHRNQTIVNRLDEYLHLLKTEPSLVTTVLPISDGMTISVKRSLNAHGEKA